MFHFLKKYFFYVERAFKYSFCVQTIYSLFPIFNVPRQVYWFKDGTQILRKNVHFRKFREGDGTCALHIERTTADDDGNYTVMASNPQVTRTGFSSSRRVDASPQPSRLTHAVC